MAYMHPIFARIRNKIILLQNELDLVPKDSEIPQDIIDSLKNLTKTCTRQVPKIGA